VVKFQIDNVNAPEHEDQLLLENASRQVDESIEKLREISNNLMPSSLLRKGLFISIKDFVRHVEPTTSAKITFNNECNTKAPEDLSVHIYRVVKEVIHNGIKHSQASQITINCKEDTRWLTIHYFDNGTGFDIKKAVAVSTGFGLRNLKSRVEIIGGTMVSESKPGRGSAFLFKFPLNK
jgi:signal transduction histidine kinase